jgi:hypothetical protein
MPEVEIFDVCIIGSGPASAFAAHELSSSGKSVIIVESGNESIEMDIKNTIDMMGSDISGNINFGISNQLGGASNLWGGWLVKFNRIDFITREFFNLKGWPIQYDEISSYYKRVDEYLNLNGTSDTRYDSSRLELRQSEIMNLPYNTKTIIDSDIDLLTNTEAVNFNVDKFCSKVVSLTCLDKKLNTLRQIKSKNFILASGGINNVRIMLHSFDTIRDELVFNYSNIGKCISTHPKAEVGRIRLYSAVDKPYNFLNIKKKKISYLKCQVGLIEKALAENNLLNHCIRIDLPGKSKLIKLFEKFSSYSLNSKHSVVRAVLLSKPIVNFGQLLFKLIETIDINSKKNNYLTVRCFFDQERRSSNKIILSTKKSNSGVPLAKILWKFEKEDWDNVELFLRVIKKELEELKIGEFIYDIPTSYIGIHSHFIGGTTMGKKSDDSVVDENLKVHGIDNLYISGPSVFPSFGYANPFYTIAALSIRLSDHLKSKI